MFFRKSEKKEERIYLDYAAATPIDDEVLSLFTGLLSEEYANPGALHKEGVDSKNKLEESRSVVAKLVSANPDEIIFTSGGTESDVLAIRGIVKKFKEKKLKKNPHVIISAIEHAAIWETAHQLEKEGEIELSILPVDERGLVMADELKNIVKENTILVSVIYVNNEIGVFQKVSDVAKELRRLKKKMFDDRKADYPLLHTDASQAVGFLEVDVRSLGVDLMTFNSGKIYGPKGVGALYIKRGIKLAPIFYEGGQEKGIRPGTENVPAIVAFARALEIAVLSREKEYERLSGLKNYFIQSMDKLMEDAKLKDLGLKMKINSLEDFSSPHILNVSFEGLESDQMVIELDARGVFVSSKSACKTLDPQVSHVLSAIGYEDNSWGSIRFSFGRETNKDQLDKVTTLLKEVLVKLLHTKKEFNL
jgi:cysteine desulfurase